jgi:hypothetical protein
MRKKTAGTKQAVVMMGKCSHTRTNDEKPNATAPATLASSE